MMHPLLLAMSLPVLTAVVVALSGRRPNLRDSLMVVGALLTFVANIVVAVLVGQGKTLSIALAEPFSGHPIAFAADPAGLIYALVASGLWPITAIYGVGYMRGHHEKNQTRFFIFFSLSIAFALWIAYSRNLITLFSGYEALTLCTYPLVTHHQNDDAIRAGRVYLGILVSTSVMFLLLALLWTIDLAGTGEFRLGGILPANLDQFTVAALAALFVFGTGKAAVMPFHRWLPAAMVAPTPVSALLHAVAVVKAGVFTITRVAMFVFGFDQISRAGIWLPSVAAWTMLVAGMIAIGKDNLKARLAWSTISQLSYIVLGATLATAAGAVGALLHIVMHATGKITLFFAAGALQVAAHKKSVSQLDGIARRMPWTMAAFAIGTVAIIGLPPTGTIWSKWFLARGAIDAGRPLFAAVVMAGSLLSVAYLVPVVIRAWLRPLPDGVEATSLEREHPLIVAPLVVTALLSIGLLIGGGWIADVLTAWIARGGQP